ncbi:MAG: L,D-transpeptidase [Actinobacteria bacterium]|nr:L,D-transpeptidase [Actinomycetota bacterium]
MARWMVRSLPVVVALAVVAVLATLGFSSTEDPVVPTTVQLATAEPGAPQLTGSWKVEKVSTSPTSFDVADAVGPSVGLYSEPDVPYEPKPSLANPTHEGLPVVFLVLEDHDAWLKVRVSSRPNNLVLWVKRNEVSLRTVPNRVVVEVGAHRVTVYHGDDVLLQAPVAVGTARTPTPLGDFFVDGIVPLSGGGPYGAGQVSVSGFSDVLQSFGGGVGQIALHGTNRPQLLGQNVSNGCVRMADESITAVMSLAPLGTPVTIVA